MKPLPWSRWLPFLNWPRPTAHLLQTEGWSALTIAVVLIPQAVAYAALAGMPLVTGLYAALLPALVAALWGGTSRLSVGPTALTCLLIASSLSGMAAPASPEWIAMAIWLALLSGVVQLFLGWGGLGWLFNLVSAPVLTGFTQAAGVLILASQLPALLGLEGHLSSLLQSPQFNTPALTFGLGSLALLCCAKLYKPHWPAVMGVVSISALASYYSDYAASGAAVVGTLPAGLPALAWPDALPWPTLGQLVVPALLIALVSFLETASSAKLQNASAGTRWNDQQDLIGQGLAKIASALSGGFATSTSFSRTAIGSLAGARSGWSGVLTAGLVLLALLFLMPTLHHVPRSVLAAVVMVAVAGLLDPLQFVRLCRVSWVEGAIALVTLVVTLLTSPHMYWGVLAGVMLSLMHHLHQNLHPRIIEVGLHPDGSLRDRHLWKLPPLAPHTYALRMDAALDFASARNFERTIAEHLAAHPDTRHVCLFAQAINRIDATGVEVFRNLRLSLAARGMALHIIGIKLPVEQVLRQTGALRDASLLHFYRTDAEALAHLAPHAASA